MMVGDGESPGPAGSAMHGGGAPDAPEAPIVPPSILPPGRHIELPGRGMTWVHEGAGPPGAPTLLLLHGWTATAGLNWLPSFMPLSRHFRVVALDHRGHGRGIRSWKRFRLEDCADDAVALADQLGISTFIPVGYSMGGPVAQLVWKRHRDRVDGLVLCATSRNFRGNPAERALFSALIGLSLAARVTPATWRNSVRTRMLEGRFDNTDLGRWAHAEVSRNNPRAIVEAGQAIGTFTSHEWIGGVDVPTAIVITEQDRVVPPHRQHKLAEAIAGSTVYPVAGDHGVCVLEPRTFVPALINACVNVSARAGRRDHAVG
jgi:3-oxoadipate enol-lactonase